MKRILQKLIIVIGFALGLQTSVNAQLVYIPDSAFRSYLYQNLAICMVGDSIDPTCPAVLNTKYIDVFNRGINDLTGIEVFVNDTLLYCGLNKVYNLPTLPSSLKYLECMSCQLTSLPALPDSLIYLNFAGNVFTNTHTLPDSLKTLICVANSFTSLPTLPSSLRHLDCTLNYLTSFACTSIDLKLL